MRQPSIELRGATETDVDAIWDLLHAEGSAWTVCDIKQHLADAFVLRRCGKLIAVLIASDQRDLCTERIFVHPGYPEQETSYALRGVFRSLALRQAE